MRDWIAWESAKRLRNWNRAERWRVLQQTITWAEGQATVRRNMPAACLREQQRKLSQAPLSDSKDGRTGKSAVLVEHFFHPGGIWP